MLRTEACGFVIDRLIQGTVARQAGFARAEKKRRTAAIPLPGDADEINSERSVSRQTLRQLLLTGLEREVHYDKRFTHYEAEMIPYGFARVADSLAQNGTSGRDPLHKPVIGRAVLSMNRAYFRAVDKVPSLQGHRVRGRLRYQARVAATASPSGVLAAPNVARYLVTSRTNGSPNW